MNKTFAIVFGIAPLSAHCGGQFVNKRGETKTLSYSVQPAGAKTANGQLSLAGALSTRLSNINFDVFYVYKLFEYILTNYRQLPK